MQMCYFGNYYNIYFRLLSIKIFSILLILYEFKYFKYVKSIYDDDDDIEFISTKIGSCRPLRSCGKKIIIK